MTQTTEQRVLGRYRLTGEIALGGTARVHRARDEQLDRDVAVKILHPHLLPDDTSRRRLAAEARAAASLSHPGVVMVYDVDPDAAAPAIVMELVDGESLAARFATHGPMAPREVARVGAEIADALYHAHRRGIVHRDVKPGNILLERESGRAKLVDFGIAHSLAAGAESLTQTGLTVGTPRYMAPEQMAGGRVGPRTDLWSLGVVLYEALGGRPPFTGPTPLAIAQAQQAGAPPLENVDPALASIIGSCLAYDTAQRPPDAHAVANALRAWLAHGSETTAQTITAPVAVVPAAPAAAPAAAPQAAGAPPRRTRRVGWIPAAVAGAALVGLAMAALLLVPDLFSGVAEQEPTRRPRATPTPTATPEPTPDPLAQLQAAYLEACGEPIPPDKLEEDDFAKLVEKVNEEITKCLEEANEEGDGEGGPPPQDDGRGNGNEGNQGRGNDGGGNDD
ncbi:MAG TPA: serine/threonine-protein kinase [Candidatus Limnocylindria bacterium]|nr:serine/threonine-protein kinase [Candidatus Limnocylindria bacterium]